MGRKRAQSLGNLRKEVDRLDGQIVTLVNRRASVARKIAKVKAEKASEVYAPDRENRVYARVKKANTGPLSEESLEAIYREIMSACLALQKPIVVSYLGPELSFTNVAALKKFGSSVNYLPRRDVPEVFKSVWGAESDYGVVPVENTAAGGVSDTLDMLLEYDLKICAEVLMDIRHNLCGRGRIEDVRTVYSNPVALRQVRDWLAANLPGVKTVSVSSTAEGARRAAATRYGAAVAGEAAARRYGLQVLARGIEDMPGNATRFLVLSKHFPGPTGNDKTSIVCSIKDRVGALSNLISPFSAHRINLTRIESRPSRLKAWEYYFFLDMNGHCRDKRIRAALAKVERQCLHLKVLGSYPAAG